MEECLFCKIVRGDSASFKIFEDESVFAFLDIFPAAKGHTLIVPKRHFETIYDIPEDILNKVMSVSKKLAEDYKKKFGIDACNIIQSNGSVAQQEIPHFHVHLIPRSKDDGINFKYNDKGKDFSCKEFQEEFSVK